MNDPPKHKPKIPPKEAENDDFILISMLFIITFIIVINGVVVD